MSTDAPELLTMKEAGGVLRVHHRTVRTWAKQGLLEEVRLGPHLVRVTARSVADMVHEGRLAALECSALAT